METEPSDNPAAAADGAPADPRVSAREAHAWWSRFSEARPDIAWAKPPEGTLRGLDFYKPEDLLKATQYALQIFRSAVGRDPDPALPRTNDHFFVQKFCMPLPHPNPADKLNAVRYLPAALRDQVRVLERPWVSESPALPPDGAVPPGRYMLKLALGNAANAPVHWPPAPAERERLNALIEKWFSWRYGIDWGEWWYGVGPQRVYLEEDVTEARAGHPEYKLFVRRGKVALVRAALYKRVGEHARQGCVLTPGFRKIEGTVDSYGPYDIKVPVSAPAMLRTASAIGGHFDLIRVDFMDTGARRPILNELTVGEQNTRRIYRPQSLEDHVREALFG